MSLAVACGSRPLEIDQVEDQVARAVDPATGRAVSLDRSGLPPGVREGDVVVDGRTDPVLTAELAAQVARSRAGLGPPQTGSFDLESGPEPGLRARDDPRSPQRVALPPPRTGEAGR